MDLGSASDDNQLFRFLPEAAHFKLMADVGATPEARQRRVSCA
jgi:hypothetical protein